MANYTETVKFTSTNNYGSGPDDENDVYTIAEFMQKCANGLFVDYDGHGHPVKDKKEDPKIFIYPSRLDLIPKDATHICWYNK